MDPALIEDLLNPIGLFLLVTVMATIIPNGTPTAPIEDWMKAYESYSYNKKQWMSLLYLFIGLTLFLVLYQF